MRLLPYGDRAVLAEVEDVDEAMALAAAVVADGSSAVAEVVPAARTVLVVAAAGFGPGDVRAVLARTSPDESVDPGTARAPEREREAREVVEIPVVYDGADLDDVARLTGLSRSEVVDAHTGQTWRVAFGGFAPGFGYLVGEDDRLHVPRRAEPRTSVPAGSVALAGEYAGVYPRASPGGWQLVGRTDVVLFDVDRDPPALLRPGVRVRLVEVRP